MKMMKSVDYYFAKYGDIYDYDEEIKELLTDSSFTIQANLDVLPECMGAKVYMHWFMHTLPFKKWKEDVFRTSITVDKKKCEFEFILPTDSEFCRHNNLSDWFVVPFKGAKKVEGGWWNKNSWETKSPPNWYELFIIMNDLIWKGDRHIDCAITSINFDSDSKTIHFDMSS